MSTTYPQFPATSFPDSFQDIMQFLDVTSTDALALKKFKEAYLAGNTQTAQSFLQTISNYSQKILTASILNKIADTIKALEKFYGSDIATILTNKQTEWQSIIDQFSYINQWNSITQYKKNNMVSFINTTTGINDLYIVVGSNSIIGQNPMTDTNNWKKVTIQGNTGSSGVNGAFGFNWNNTTTYSINTIVVYSNKWWIALQSNTNQPPAENSNWHLVLDFNSPKYPVQPSQPPNSQQQNGELWFKTL